MAKKSKAKNAASTADARDGKRIKSIGAPDASKARTIVFVHGIANKPPPDVLKLQWDKALLGFDLGERSRMAYWVNRERHGAPLGPELDPDEVAALAPKSSVGTFSVNTVSKPEMNPEAEAAMARISKELGAHTSAPGFSAKILPLPGFARDWVARAVTSWWLEDVHDFLFVEERRKVMRDSLISRLSSGGGPFVIVAHSQGTMIAYDVLSNWSGPPIEVDLLVTVGSPLGLTEVQDQLKPLTKQKKLATPPMVKRWENFAASGDPVALDKELKGDYKPNAKGVEVNDHKGVKNPVKSNAHSGIGYLSLKEVRDVVLQAINTSLFQPVAEFTIAKNLNRDMTTKDDGVRHRVLIELQDQKPLPHLHVLTDGLKAGADTGFVSLEESRKSVVAWIRQQAIHALGIKVKAKGPTDEQLKAIDDEVHLEALNAYVSANLTRSEVERLSATMRNASVFRIFKNSTKAIHLKESTNTIQAHTAHLGYQAKGQRINWAVLDSGVDWGHEHFGNIKDGTCVINKVFECSLRSDEPAPVDFATLKPKKGAPGWDGNGHGSHVAGIIAGGVERLGIAAIAPSANLWCYKVLDDQGEGGDSKIIKALDHIYKTNDGAPSLRIHGVNLSLGGPFDAEVFGCGDTPLCKSLRKLWRQGVVVVVSAGNEGIVQIPGVGTLSMDLSIGDPANLDECIVVGSVHATKPHLYGVSYFSSRGPTADGRAKPDIVAPGEKILSCLAGGRGTTEGELYTRMSGTSMAAPHISGVAACFLSARREFIGFPEKVKTRMMEHATDLARDRMHQGAGLVNLVKMLINS
jgi:subtilisin family serine protease